MKIKLEDRITKEEAWEALQECVDTQDDGTQTVTYAKEMHEIPMQVIFFGMPAQQPLVQNLGVGEMPLACIKAELIDDDECVVDWSWATHLLFGECLTATLQCLEHPDDPTDRNTIRFLSVRR